MQDLSGLASSCAWTQALLARGRLQHRWVIAALSAAIPLPSHSQSDVQGRSYAGQPA